MRESLVIFRRELKGYFYSPIAYVFGVLMTGVLWAWREGALRWT